MKKKWKIVLVAAVLLGVGALAAIQLLQPVEVEAEKVTPREIRRSFTEEGVVKAIEEHTVYAMLGGRVQTLAVKEGERVEKGDLLLALEDEEVSHAMAELEARLKGVEGEELKLAEAPGPAEVESQRLRIEEAKESLEAARRNYERVENLYPERYELQVEEAEQNLRTAEQNYDRIKQLYQEDIVSRAEYEEAQEMLARAENRLEQQEHAQRAFQETEYDEAGEMVRKAEHNLAQQEKALSLLYESYEEPEGSREIIEGQRAALQSQLDLYRYKKDNHRLHAPFSGVVARLEAEENEPAVPQEPLMTLFQPGGFRVETHVLARDVYDIAEGMAVEITLELRDRDVVFPGEVARIAPYAEKSLSPLGLEEERVKVTVTPDLPDELEVAPGYRVDVEFTTEEQTGALVVPRSALFSYEGQDALLVAENGRAAVRKVETGFETRQEVAITGGLEEGDLVILDPETDDLEENTRVSYTLKNSGE